MSPETERDSIRWRCAGALVTLELNAISTLPAYLRTPAARAPTPRGHRLAKGAAVLLIAAVMAFSATHGHS